MEIEFTGPNTTLCKLKLAPITVKECSIAIYKVGKNFLTYLTVEIYNLETWELGDILNDR